MQTGFNRLLCMALCTPRLPNFSQVQKQNLVLLFGFPPVAFLISNRLQCVISQMKDNEFMIKFIIYYFWVGVMPFELWSIEFTVQLLFLHTVYQICSFFAHVFKGVYKTVFYLHGKTNDRVISVISLFYECAVTSCRWPISNYILI